MRAGRSLAGGRPLFPHSARMVGGAGRVLGGNAASGWVPCLDAIVLQLLNGLDKGGAYALIALGLTLVFGTLGVVNFAHGALFMLGAFCAVAFAEAPDALRPR